METLNKIWKKFGKSSNPEIDHHTQSIKRVAVFGYADTKEGDALYNQALKIGEALALAGYTVVDGGGPGVMEAVSRGAKSAGGKVIGVTFYPPDAVNFEGRDPENPIDIEIKTGNYVDRTLTLLKEGQVYVVCNGSSGTMSEFAMAWGLARIYFGHHKPLILYGEQWKDIMNSLRKNLLVRKEETEVYKIVTTPEQMLAAIRKFEDGIKKGEYDNLVADYSEGTVTI